MLSRPITFVKNAPIFLLACYCIIVLGATLYPFSFSLSNHIDVLEKNGIRFSPPSIMYTDPIPGVLSSLKRFSIVVLFTPESESLSDSRTIVSNAINSFDQNFSIVQSGRSLVFRLFDGGRQRSHVVYLENAIRKDAMTAFTVSFDGEMLRCYVDGIQRTERSLGPIDPMLWNNTYPLVVGSEANGYHPWHGVMYSLDVFDTVVSSVPVIDQRQGPKKNPPVLSFLFKNPEGGLIRSIGTDSSTVLHIPMNFTPYQRTYFLEGTTAVWKRRWYLRDVFGNIMMFVPIGFLLVMLFTTRNHDRKRNALLVCVMAFLFSMSIEFLQVFLPGRFSSISDILCNTIGACAGAAVFQSILKRMKGDAISFIKGITL